VPQLRVALAQVNATVGDLDRNAGTIVEWTARAASAGASVVVFPEMMLTGYPVEDLALRGSFVTASIAALHGLAGRLADTGLGGIAVVTGYLDRQAGLRPRVGLPAGAPQDAAAVLHDGRIVVTSAKHHLPNYGVFDEFRYFVPGNVLPVVRTAASSGEQVEVAVAICEDLWQDGGPVVVTRQAGAPVLLVPNASPYERGKGDERLALCRARAAEAGAVLAYVNLVGGQDELVFDGDSIVVAADGSLLARGPQFEEALIVADLDVPAASSAEPGDRQADARDGTTMTIRRVALAPVPRPATRAPAVSLWPRLGDLAEVYAALVLGVRDYVPKNGFGSVILALSGGIDSALTATIAADAIGPDRVHVVLMPSEYSSAHSVADAEDLVKRQGLRARTVPIASIVAAFEADPHLAVLAHGTGAAAVAHENLQARVRGMIVMSLSNAEGHLVLTTGNKSELATGYSTLYGDSAGGFAPLKDVPKTLVWELSRWRNEQAAQAGELAPIPENSIIKPPSAELRPGQLDSDTLPDYAELDPVLDGYVGRDLGAAELVAAGHDPALVERVIAMVDRAEYKRRQYPPGPKISAKNFGRDRRLPITNRWREPRAGN